VWEYANLVNVGLKRADISGWCVVEEFLVELVPKKLDWVAVKLELESSSIVLRKRWGFTAMSH
jgi:hypothetical protein